MPGVKHATPAGVHVSALLYALRFCAGVATALKILFSSRDCSGELPDTSQLPFGEELVLERNEVIALINLLGRFSHSLETYHILTAELQQQQGVTPSIADKAAVV